MLICYTVSFILIVAGILFYTGKAASYIEGYRDMPEEEKKTINIVLLCRNISVMLLLAAAIFALAGFSELFRVQYLKWTIIGWIVLCCVDVAFINKSGRYENETPVSQKKSHGKEGRHRRPKVSGT